MDNTQIQSDAPSNFSLELFKSLNRELRLAQNSKRNGNTFSGHVAISG